MEKLQALITLHKDKLEELWLTPLVVDPQSRELAQAILLDWYTDWEPNWLAMSFAELLFNTPFLSWLERYSSDADIINREYDDAGVIQSYTTKLSTSDYHKINLALLNTDSERITYITNNTI